MPENMQERSLTRDELILLADSINRTEVTFESLPILRVEIAELRETKILEPTAIESIRRVRKGAEKIGAHEDVVNLYWEEYLVGKHYLMRARDERYLPDYGRALFTTKGLMLMRSSAKNASAYIDKHDVESLRPRSHRFLGEVDMISKRYRKAVEHFQTAVDLFNKMEDPMQRVNALEISGFLAEALVLSGYELEGISLARKTFAQYDYGYAVMLKEKDYYTWAVWKSGCATKVWNAILSRKIMPYGITKEGLIGMLNTADDITVFPNGETTWGDKNFQIRKDEIARIKKQIGI